MIVRRRFCSSLALAAVAVLPSTALAQFTPGEERSCVLPMKPDDALKTLRALSNKGTSSSLKSGGVGSGTRLRVNQFAGDRLAWTVRAQVEPEFSFLDPVAALAGNEIAFGTFSLGLAYNGARL